MNRRNLLSGAVLPLGFVLAARVEETLAYDNPRRLRPRRVLARRRFRRRAVTRVMFGRRMWVVPVGLAVGWELFHSNRVVLVREIRVIERELVDWMREHEYESVTQLKGSLSQKNCADPSAFERAQYMRAISSFPVSQVQP